MCCANEHRLILTLCRKHRANLTIRWALGSLGCQRNADRHLPLDHGRPCVGKDGRRDDERPARVEGNHPAPVWMRVAEQVEWIAIAGRVVRKPMIARMDQCMREIGGICTQPSRRPRVFLDAPRADFTPNLRPGLRRGFTAQFTSQTWWSSSEKRSSVARIALDQKVEGSNPSSPANSPPEGRTHGLNQTDRQQISSEVLEIGR